MATPTVLYAGLRYGARIKLFTQTGPVCVIQVARWLRDLRWGHLDVDEKSDFFRLSKMGMPTRDILRTINQKKHHVPSALVQGKFGRKVGVFLPKAEESADARDKAKARKQLYKGAHSAEKLTCLEDRRNLLIEGGFRYMLNSHCNECKNRLILRKDKAEGVGVKSAGWGKGWSPAEPFATDDWRAGFLKCLYNGQTSYLGEEVYYFLDFSATGDQGHAVGIGLKGSMFYFFDPLLGEMRLPLMGGTEKTLHAWLHHRDTERYFRFNAGELTMVRFLPVAFDIATLKLPQTPHPHLSKELLAATMLAEEQNRLDAGAQASSSSSSTSSTSSTSTTISSAPSTGGVEYSNEDIEAFFADLQ